MKIAVTDFHQWLPGILCAFRTKYPDLKLDVIGWEYEDHQLYLKTVYAKDFKEMRKKRFDAGKLVLQGYEGLQGDDIERLDSDEKPVCLYRRKEATKLWKNHGYSVAWIREEEGRQRSLVFEIQNPKLFARYLVRNGLPAHVMDVFSRFTATYPSAARYFSVKDGGRFGLYITLKEAA